MRKNCKIVLRLIYNFLLLKRKKVCIEQNTVVFSDGYKSSSKIENVSLL